MSRRNNRAVKNFWFGLYNLIVYLAAFGIRIIAVFNTRYRSWLRVRRNWRAVLKTKIGDEPFWIWFHASSSGEFEDGIEVLKRMREKYPHYKVLVSFFSSSGYEQYRNDPVADAVCYLPLDTKRNARDFYRIVQPSYIVFSRNDIWPNFVDFLRGRDNSPYLLSFICARNSKFFGFPQRHLYRYVFNSFEAIGTQNEATRELLEEHFNVYNAFYAGNTRNTRIQLRAQNEFHDDQLDAFSREHFTITVGSALKKDIEFILKCSALLQNVGVRWIIVPHDPKELLLENSVSADRRAHILWSKKEKAGPHHRFLWLDTIGILAETYKYSTLAWIGGGFDPIGIHNIMEPVARNNYVAFGPNHRNYPEAHYSMNAGFGFCFSKPEDFAELIKKAIAGEIKSTPSIPEEDKRAVDFHVGLMERESGLE